MCYVFQTFLSLPLVSPRVVVVGPMERTYRKWEAKDRKKGGYAALSFTVYSSCRGLACWAHLFSRP
jgi:hypothetical protein